MVFLFFLPECLFNLVLDLLVLLPLVLLLLECLQPLEQPSHLLDCALTLIPRLLIKLQGLHQFDLERSDLVGVGNLVLVEFLNFQLKFCVLEAVL